MNDINKRITILEIVVLLIITAICYYLIVHRNMTDKTIDCEYHLIVSQDSIKIIDEEGLSKTIPFDSAGQISKIILDDNR